jgi:cobalt-zinc-cadmium efflux system protein
MKFDHHAVHAEDHLGQPAVSSIRNLRMVFWLNFSFTLAEFIGGALTNSVAIQSDALHDLGDTLAIGFAWWLQRKSTQHASADYTFGYQRFSLLGALVNGLILLVGGGVVLWKAFDRLGHPEAVHTGGMLGFAVAGILLNGVAAWRASKGTSMNERVLSWHLVEDVLGWVAVGVVSVVMLYRPEWTWLDPALSLAITALILFNVVRRLASTLRVFLQGLPEGMDLNAIQAAVLTVPQVASIHACRVWSLDGERNVFSAHVTLTGVGQIQEVPAIKSAIYTALAPWGFHDITIETEFV